MSKKIRINKTKKLEMKFDIPMLNTMIKYMQCSFNSKQELVNLLTLTELIDLEIYNYSSDIQNRLIYINIYLTAIIKRNISEVEVIKSFISEQNGEIYDFSMLNDFYKSDSLTISECKYISESINERLQCLYIFEHKDEITDLLEEFEDTKLTSYAYIIKSLKEKVSTLLVKLTEVNASDEIIKNFSFSDEDYSRLLDKIVTKAKRPGSILMTGIQKLNEMLSPGFHSGRLYTLLGGSGKFKSGTLLNIADQVRRYNPQIQPVENGKRKTILYITMEDSINETIIKLFDMYSDVNDDIRTMATDDVIRILKERGDFEFNTNKGINIDFVYRSNMEIKPSDIHTMIKDLSEHGKEVICIFLDYLLLMDSDAPWKDEKSRLSNVTKELKSIASNYEVPVISAMQLNRSGNAIIDAAMRESKTDIANYIGSTDVGIAWEIIQDSDWVAIVNPEIYKVTGEKLLTIKNVKIRYKKNKSFDDYINHPFENEKNIRLAIDIHLKHPLSRLSMKSDLIASDDEDDKYNPNKRPKVTDKKTNSKSTTIKSIDLDELTPSIA